jgi:CheY-like chemotaxis protein
MYITASDNDILLAEDDNDEVLIFEMALNQLKIPYHLRTVDNGDKLFIVLKERKPHILFLDMHMPCKDGMSCIVEIRKNRDYDDLPVIVYTSDVSKRTIEDTYRNGANLYLTKADTLTELTGKLKNILSKEWNAYLHFPSKDQYVH